MQVPAKFRYPFYGTIHWYAILRYSQALHSLREAGVRRPQNGKWLKSVAVAREIVTVGGPSAQNVKWLQSVTVEKLPLLPTSNSSEEIPLECPPISQETEVNTTDWATWVKSEAPSSGNSPSQDHLKPHLSDYEREGLLHLLTKMVEENLFEHEAPPSISQPRSLLDTLRCQLESTSLHTSLSPRPTGVALLTPSRNDMRRGVKRRRGGLQPAKHKLAETKCVAACEKVETASNELKSELESPYDLPLPAREVEVHTSTQEEEEVTVAQSGRGATVCHSEGSIEPELLVHREPVCRQVLCHTIPPLCHNVHTS